MKPLRPTRARRPEAREMEKGPDGHDMLLGQVKRKNRETIP